MVQDVQYGKKFVFRIYSFINSKLTYFNLGSHLTQAISRQGANGIFTARIQRMGKVIVSLCLSVHNPGSTYLGGGTYPSQVQMGGGGYLPWPGPEGGTCTLVPPPSQGRYHPYGPGQGRYPLSGPGQGRYPLAKAGTPWVVNCQNLGHCHVLC